MESEGEIRVAELDFASLSGLPPLRGHVGFGGRRNVRLCRAGNDTAAEKMGAKSWEPIPIHTFPLLACLATAIKTGAGDGAPDLKLAQKREGRNARRISAAWLASNTISQKKALSMKP